MTDRLADLSQPAWPSGSTACPVSGWPVAAWTGYAASSTSSG